LSWARRIKYDNNVNVGEESWSKNIILKNPSNTSHIVIYMNIIVLEYFTTGN